jgi:hypothetical protein
MEADAISCGLCMAESRRDRYRRLSRRVDRGGLIDADRNIYSPPSRLLGEKVEVRLYVEQVGSPSTSHWRA